MTPPLMIASVLVSPMAAAAYGQSASDGFIHGSGRYEKVRQAFGARIRHSVSAEHPCHLPSVGAAWYGSRTS